jgi:hypothetical protein
MVSGLRDGDSIPKAFAPGILACGLVQLGLMRRRRNPLFRFSHFPPHQSLIRWADELQEEDMHKKLSLMAVLGLLSALAVSCGTKYPSVRLDEIKFYITDVSVNSSSEAGFSDITIELVAENVGKNSVPFPKYSETWLGGAVTLEGKVGTETYTYGTNAFYEFDSLPPNFRSKYILTYKVAKTASDLKLTIGIYEPSIFVEHKLAEGSMRVNLSGEFPSLDIPVDHELLFSSLGTSTSWCPNTMLSLQSIQRIDFGIKISQTRFTGIVLNVAFQNNSGETLSPFCPNIKTALFTNTAMIFHKTTSVYSSTNIASVSPGSSATGKIFLIFEQFPANTDLNGSWFSLRRYKPTWSFLGGNDITDDVQIVYKIPSISTLQFNDFSSSDFGSDFEYNWPMTP